MKKFLYNVLNQVLPVMLGVYLGFALNDFSQNRKEQKEIELYAAILQQEILQNQEVIARVLPYHRKLKATFTSLREAEDPAQALKQIKFKGLQPALLSKSAFQTGLQSGNLQRLPLQVVQKLNRLYSLQERYSEFTNDMVSGMISRGMPKDAAEMKEGAQMVVVSMNDVLPMEQSLSIMYAELLTHEIFKAVGEEGGL